MYNEKIRSVTLHAFADASSKGVSAAVYAVVDQVKEKSQGLLTSKSRLAKKNLTIPPLALIATHMATNLLSNAKIALRKYPIRNCYGWSDSTTVLFWMDGQTAQQCYSGYKITLCKSSLLATECIKSSNRTSSSGIMFQQQKILQTLVVEGPKELISKTHGQMDQAGYLTEKIGTNK